MTERQCIVVVDDDREIRELVKEFLTQHGFDVMAAADGADMRKVLSRQTVDLVVLDIMLPGEDGLSLCRELRRSSDLPVIMLTALGDDTDRIVGLEIGADDYLAKPFNPRELLARIKAVLRRADGGERYRAADNSPTLEFEGWQVDTGKRELRSPDKVLIPLTAGEFDLLVALAENPKRVLSRDQLLDLTKGRIAGPFDRSVDVQLSRLRRKLDDDPKAPRLIKTVRGGGYLFAPAVRTI